MTIRDRHPGGLRYPGRPVGAGSQLDSSRTYIDVRSGRTGGDESGRVRPDQRALVLRPHVHARAAEANRQLERLPAERDVRIDAERVADRAKAGETVN